MLRVRLCGDVQVEADGRALLPSLLAGRQGRLVFAYLACHRHRPVPREELAELLWPDRVPDSWTTSLSAVVSRLRRLLGEAGLDGQSALAGSAGAYQLHLPADTWVDWEVAQASIAAAEAAVAEGDATTSLAAAAEAAAIVEPGFLTDDCAWVDEQREAARDIAVRAALVKGEAHLLAGAPRRAVEEARDAIRRDPLRESGFRVLMRALAAAGERAEALRMWEHCRTTLVEELGVDPSPETESVYLQVLEGGPPTAPPPSDSPATTALPSGVVTFLLTDIVESTVLWDRQPAAMAQALERHDAAVTALVVAHGGTVLKSKLEGDATVSVFARATAGAHAALALQDALEAEAWPEGAAPRVRMALHTGEAFERAGDYFGPALNRAARLRSLADGGQVLLSQAVAELVVDHLPEGVALADRGHRDLRGLSRGENVFELVRGADVADTPAPLDRPPVPAVLVPSGPFIGRSAEREAVLAQWQSASSGSPRAVLLAGEPGVGKSRLAADVARTVHARGGSVLYGRCDEELGAPLQPFVEALRPLIPALGARRLRAVQGVDELSRVVPEVADLLPDAKRTSSADPDAERYALFDAISRVLTVASSEAPVLLVLDDLHWAGKTTLALLRHLLRSAEGARLLVVGTYRDTELARTHPFAATLADLHHDATAERITLGGLGADEVVAYLEAVGRHDRALGRELAEVTSGNPFFLIETLRHVEETGGTWEKGSLPQGVREATGRRLSRLSDAANDALAVAAVAGSAFSLELVEAVRGADLVDEIAEACRTGLVIEDIGTPGRFRFAHALVRQVLLAELVTVKRMRLHRTIAELLEADGDADANLTELAYHWFECAATGNADKAVTYCRRAADRAMERLAHEEAADLYGMALQALEGVEDDRDRAELLLARADALLTAGEVGPARAALEDLRRAAVGDAHLEAWQAIFAGQLAVLAEPDRLPEIVASIGDAADAMHEQGDVVGEAKAHYVHSLALERLGQIGAAERALDAALGAARQAGDRRLADAVLACAPQAALWGPSPVPRASGRCLDVVRVLRITSGTPSVEAVALRCQAVLEALRGRTDAARKMIASSRLTLEELGLAHRVLESEVMAGLIELLDEEPVAAEALLRPASEALRDRGLDGEAALAAALLGRALLQQRRDEEAEAVGEEAAQLAGADLKAAITWRGVLAEAAARRGAFDRARELARAAVDLATATDALLLVADARRSLASVLRLAGDDAAAAAEARRTAEACDAKGATALADRARAALADGSGTASTRDGLAAAPIESAAARFGRRFGEAWESGSWDRITAALSESWRVSDRRRYGLGELSAEESRAVLQDLVGRNRSRWLAEEVLATRGDRLLLARGRAELVEDEEPWADAGPRDVGFLNVVEADPDGRGVRVVFFDLGDVGTAFEELDRRYAEGEASSAVAAWRGLRELDDAITAADPARLRACLAPGFVGTLASPVVERVARGSDEFVDYLLGMTALRPDVRTHYRHVLALEPTRALVVTSRGVAHDFEFDAALVFRLDPAGRLVRQWGFPVEELDDAWACYRELGRADDPIDERFRNLALRVHEDFVDAWTARDWERVQALFAPAWRLSDRRSQGSGDLSTEESRTSLRYVFDTRRVHWVVEEVLATRGDRLLLVRRRIDIGQDDRPTGEWRSLSIWRVDEQGRRDLSVDFDEDDVDAAFDELDRLYLEGDGAVGSALWQHAGTLVRAINAGDREAAMRCFAPGFRFVGHGLLGWGELDAPEFVAHTMKTFDLRPDAEIRARHVLALDSRRALTVGSNSLSGDYEVVFANLTQADGDGRIVRRDSWSLDQLDEAWERYHALAAADAGIGERFPNAATRFIRAVDAAFNARDFDAFTALHGPDVGFVDRRTGGDVGAAIQLDWMRPAFEGGADLRRQSEVLATRGSRLALAGVSHHGTWGAAGETDITYLAVCEVDATGLGLGAVIFDREDMDSAYEELDRRFLESEGAAGRRLWERGHAFARASDAGDDATAAEWLAPGFTFVSHRSFGWGDLDGAGFVAHARTLHEVRDDATIRVRHALAVDEGRSLVVSCLEDKAGEQELEMPFVSVNQTDAQGRAIRRDVYDLDQLDEARARYEEIGRSETPIGARFPNAATRGLDELGRAWNAKDLDAFVSLLAPGFQQIDTRLWHSRLTRDEFLLDIRPHFDVGLAGALNLLEQTPLATRGDRLALVRTVQVGSWRRPGGPGSSERWDAGETTLEYLCIREVDEDCRILRNTVFDVNDIDAAYEELDRRSAEIERPPPSWEHVRRWVEAVNADDRDVAVALFAPGFRFVAHQPIGWGELDRDGYLEHVFGLSKVRSDVRIRIHHALALEDRRSMTVGTVTDTGGADFSLETIMVLELDEQRREVRRDAFRPDQLDEAWDRYHQIGPAEAAIGAMFPNAATRRAEALVDAWNAWDFETFSSLFAPDYRFLVHRGSTAELNREEHLADIGPRFDDPDGLTRRQTPFATRGQRLALVRLSHESTWREAGHTVFDDLLVVEVDGDGRGTRTALFATEDLDAAHSELDRWYGEQLGSGAPARWLGEITASMGAYNRGDTGVRPEPWASAGRIHDHRLTGARTYGPDEWIAAAGALRAMAEDARVRLVHVIDATPQGTFSCVAVTGSYESGPFEVGQLHVHDFRRGAPGVERIHIYDLDGLEAARARWAEVRGRPTSRAPEL